MKIKYSGIYFLLLVAVLYGMVFFIKTEIFYSSLNSSIDNSIKVLLTLAFVFLLTIAFNYFFTSEKIKKYFGKEAGKKSWFFSVVFGILSMGPIYLWYPFLSELRNKGAKLSLISVFLYNRSIKIPLLPIMLFYFEIEYVFILAILMIFISLIQGVIIEKFLENENRDSIRERKF